MTMERCLNTGAMLESTRHQDTSLLSRERERLEQEGIGDKQKVITRMKGLDGQVDHRLAGQSHHSLALDS